MKLHLISLLSLNTLALSVPNPISGSDNVVVRDPAIAFNPDSNKYFVFSTGGGINIFTSSSLNGPWTSSGSVLPNGSKINTSNPNIWAPDVHSVNGQYTLYYSLSTLGSQNSTIGVATSPSMEQGTWDDLGPVIGSKDGDSYNAIDANLIDAEGLKLSFGSYNDGIFQITLSDIHTPAANLPGTHLAGANKEPTEGGFTYKPQSSQYYFQFFSNGFTPLVNTTTPRPAPGGEYKVLVGRSENVSGPFLDKTGNDLTKDASPPTGTLVLGSHDNIYAPGGQSIFFDANSGRDLIVYHYVRNDSYGGPSYLGINFLDFTSGWPVVVGE
ncbi:glycoside hydrolase family 43 protein [Dichomitus squalens]|uniref:Arabinan endo-1,5-alpha-L-arabinosidase n=1 Tax=Dichomitus squalens TaxID=114155 RepID=A0A4Q9MGW9_9APHY|nr:glycoside hydrolase family 43 protein [Dichomitus squalens]